MVLRGALIPEPVPSLNRHRGTKGAYKFRSLNPVETNERKKRDGTGSKGSLLFRVYYTIDGSMVIGHGGERREGEAAVSSRTVSTLFDAARL